MYDLYEGNSYKIWAVPSPRAPAASQVVRLCLHQGGRLAVSQGDGTELYVMYGGVGASSSSQLFAAYVQVGVV